ncbi:MAG: 3-methyl-2-oxobutanoate hydroxymethyltransferase [Gemmatimonadetes bacterium]|jgi:3-methyl-2-oxobutanoate hydroxymethyltransferase|nr:3-methyl-2-oxobutanoate hydroxymethyltransferase [Gemmatimonadota bacterium]MBT5325302.1 3-methyl-2-oxobutanoate hydroxymethyltransferase [Gemmatimonadota bacterium]MBT5450988.1 3-methyl-2-oxobutanoate hydroxymethyltransferase [Gemmatimonadota bacterium]MBT5801626.1 3-methyl-2-oxobutanoate hydroxymethyltransferase [Gemmatimonadota bacterium]MBT6621686.1 3-methyl-2-oxobutanoate hydroxymethyltransferase [Gemmatimonadota bacterium]|tara:strand:+ start:939 stop:1835 length:897 start_codon:yes stop_codon:yes gene_type:complete
MPNTPDKITASSLQSQKQRGQKISMLTAYDYPTALLQDEAGIDVIFVGDSVGTNVLGYRSPQQVTMDDILHHLRAVRRAVRRAYLLADLPFMSYQASVETAVENAGRLVQEGGTEGVKLEGGLPVLPQVKAIVEAGIPVVGHLGFTPQSQAREFYLFSDRRGTVPKFQGKGPKGAKALIEEALRLEDAGIFALVLELVTEEAAQAVTERLSIPVIGIGAGRYCDGQVLIVHDLVGLNEEDLILAKAYGQTRQVWLDIFSTYRREVAEGLFPTAENVAHMEPDKHAELDALLKGNGKND